MFWRRDKQPQTIKDQDLGKKYLAVLKVSNIVGMTLDLDDILQKSVDVIVKELGYFSAVIFLNNPENKKVVSKTFTNSFLNKLMTFGVVKGSFNGLFVTYDNKDNSIVKTVLDRTPIESPVLADFLVPVLNKSVSTTVQKLAGIKAIISVPILYQDKCMGAIMFSKRQADSFSDDKDILEIYANQIAVAIYNAQIFQEKQTQLKIIEARNTDLQAMTDLITTVNKTLDPQKVAQSAVDLLNKQNFIVGGTLSLYNEKRQASVPIAITENAISRKVREAIGDISLLVTEVNNPQYADDPKVIAFKSGKAQHAVSLEAYLQSVLPRPVIRSLASFLHVKSVSIYPLSVHNKVVGTLSYYLKDKNYHELEPDHQQMLDTYTLQISIALENANLYAETKNNQEKLTKANTSLEEAVNALKESQRRERDMLDVMGHELRTPISIVRNALLMLDREHKKHDLQDEEIVKYLSMAIESTRREIFLIETLLSATKVDGSRIQLYFEQVGMKDVITDAVEAQSSTLHLKGLKLIYTPPHNDVLVYADRTRTQEIMDNLLSNAIKYTTKGEVKISLWQDDKFGWLSVADSGMGIAPEDLQKLGHKFFRAKQYVPNDEHGADALKVVRPGGTGLGLYVTFELVGSMEGQLYINSEVGKGSTFTFGLPLFTNQKPKQLDQTFDPHKHKDHSHIFIGKDAPTSLQKA